jgi:hypothetical protein
MRVFPRRVEHPLDTTVQRFHDADASEHRRPALFGDEQQRIHCCLLFVGVMLCLGQFGDELRRVAERDQGIPTRYHDRIEETVGPTTPN